jgi:hypothetical protein
MTTPQRTPTEEEIRFYKKYGFWRSEIESRVDEKGLIIPLKGPKHAFRTTLGEGSPTPTDVLISSLESDKPSDLECLASPYVRINKGGTERDCWGAFKYLETGR